MAKEFYNRVISQPSLYDPQQRLLTYYYDIPDSGVNRDTGILMLIGAYGASVDSGVFKKMRNILADKYNMITLQCDYFGSEFMWVPMDDYIRDAVKDLESSQLSDREKIELGVEDLKALIMERLRNAKYSLIIHQDETPALMNDMGPVQAMDHLTALYSIDRFLVNGGITYNRNKIVSFGSSHGAYLGELCDCFMPGVISSVIDIGGYIYPNYLDSNVRILRAYPGVSDMEINFEFDDLIREIVFDKELYHLPTLYKEIDNNARIIAYHGEHDFLTEPEVKRAFIGSRKGSHFELITDKDVDHDVFGSANHSLDADFFKFLDMIWSNYDLSSDRECMQFVDRNFSTTRGKYSISLEDGIPILYYELNYNYDYSKLERTDYSTRKTHWVKIIGS